MDQDCVAALPSELAAVVDRNGGELPEGVDLEPGVVCVWGDRHFVHARATLPLRAIDHGVGFGLWVELSGEDFSRYCDALEDDRAYRAFRAEGTLANDWPGFENLLGVRVVLRAVRATEKVYITEVQADHREDVLFAVAVTAPASDVHTRDQVRRLVEAWLA